MVDFDGECERCSALMYCYNGGAYCQHCGHQIQLPEEPRRPMQRVKQEAKAVRTKMKRNAK